MNRTRLFMHRLQLEKNLSWDTKLDKDELGEWKNIVRQVKKSPSISVPRFIESEQTIISSWHSVIAVKLFMELLFT